MEIRGETTSLERWTDKDNEMVQELGRMLIERHITISCCESCTGGLFAAALTEVPGISQVFDRGLVTYTEKAKMAELGVREETLKRYTVYSGEVATEMAEGLHQKTGSDLCVSVTGIAGPEGGLPGIPVGTIFVGVHYCDETKVVKLSTESKDRAENRRTAARTMFQMARDAVAHAIS